MAFGQKNGDSGNCRRAGFDDLISYRRKDDEARAKILDGLTAEAPELGIGC